MKIFCISASMVPSRTANSIQVMKACQALVQLGHTVHLMVPEIGQRISKIPDLKTYYGLVDEFPVERLATNLRLHRYDLAFRAIRRARNLQAELIYTWLPQAGLVALLQGLPLVLELHGPPEGRFGPSLFRLLLRLPGKKRLLPITQALTDLLKANGMKLDQPGGLVSTVVSPNGIDLERYTQLPDPASARRNLGLPEAPTAGYTGHLYSGRGMALLLELARRLPEVQFLWVGGRDADVQDWRSRLQDEGVDNVHLIGFVENIQLPLYQAAADVLLMPYERAISGSSGGDSAAYASPMKMFEYMACQRPILSSDLPVIREVLRENNAVLLPPDAPAVWAKNLNGLLSDSSRRNKLVNQAWQDVQSYTWLERARRALAGFPS